jgi:hypothetical protein
MLVSTIIANGRNISDVPNVSFYSDAEGLVDTQWAWADVYALLTEGNDDYFATELYIPFSGLTADANRTNMYAYALPNDFYRLRILQYGNTNGATGWFPCLKMTTEDYGRTQNAPAYKIIGVNLKIYDPVSYPMYYMLYYPAAATLALNTDLTYPLNMVPQIMSYQIAIEIRRKQKLPVEDYEKRRDELKLTMIKNLPRDDFKTEKPKNEFGSGFNNFI